MQAALARLREQLGTDSAYFAKVYTHTFDFARSEGQRSLGEPSPSSSPSSRHPDFPAAHTLELEYISAER